MNDESRHDHSGSGLGESQLDRLLSDAARQPIGLPAGLEWRIETSVRRAVRRRRIIAGTLAAAAIVAALTARMLTMPGHVPPSDRPVAGPVTPAESNPVPPLPVSTVVTVQPDDDANVIALPIETQNRNITIVWLYPTVQTASGPAETTGEQIP